MTRGKFRTSRPQRRTKPDSADELPLVSARAQAAVLLDFMQSAEGRTGIILGPQLIRSWRELHHEHHWHPVPWQSVAAGLRRLLGDDKKHSRTFRDSRGRRRRVIVWHIPTRPPAADAAVAGARKPASAAEP